MCEHNLFREIKRKVMLLVIYLFNYDSSKPIYSFIYSFCQINENSLFPALLRDNKNILLFALCFDMYFYIKT